ncbi:hypothetical protein [Desulfurivibrio alkaliphilus]|uniref:Uncharacterized protein n=1 Tax=Desulfurivibrio alkaliphilus (strain DSM 19089 / UNIQEM U267 / AHT2) TaxID=589865 RepID=D6Z706_DESAT|nr:hypothetical protein [Desulfurivibrio alkaliphilus]ADH86993.1 hypothetical protein DaAHT2_2328 [Desulfurivibrio alkaliphilus AHT 2]
MAISIDESIRIFKAEIISQDQRLPQRRSEPLLEACACLKQRFKSRKNILALLGMAEGVVLYMRKRQAVADPECLDFLKETLAHVVNIYEEGKFDPEREEELGRRMYKRFTGLKNQLQERRSPQPANRAATPSQDRPPANTNPPASKASRPTVAPASNAAGAAGSNRPHRYAPIPGESCRLIKIGEFPLLVVGKAVARLAPIKPSERQALLAATEVSLKDFSRLFRRLPRLFHGPLSKIPAGRLKKLKLPLILPRGGGLPPLPPENADHLLVLSHGQWHGVIPVRLAGSKPLTLKRFQAAANGDIAGLGTTDDDASYPLLNPRALLEREGFLTMPERD